MADLNPTTSTVPATSAAPVSAPFVAATTPDVAPQISSSEPILGGFGELESMFSDAARTPTPEPVSQPSVTPPQSSLAEQAAEFGLQLPATATEREVAAALIEHARGLKTYADFGRTLAPHANKLQQFFAQGDAPAQPAAPAAPASAAPEPAEWTPQQHFAALWEAPQLTPQMQYAINNGMVQTDAETGQIVPKPGMELFVAPIINDLNRAVSWKRDQWRSIMDGNPYQHFYEKLQEPIDRRIEQKFHAFLQSQEQTAQQSQIQFQAADSVAKFEQDNASWLFQAAAGGGQMPTEKGQQFVNMAREYGANWTGDANTLLNLCKTAVLGAQPAAAAPVPASGQPAPPAAVSVQQQQSFLETAIDRASRTSNGGVNTIQSPSGPAVVTSGELESMFLRDFQAANAA